MGALISPAAARACLPAPPELRLEGESDSAYQARSAVVQQQRADAWLKERQTRALSRANLIFIGRDTVWWPPDKGKVRWKKGRPVPPPVIVPRLTFPAPSYFKPIAWLRGAKTTDLFQLRADWTDCGALGLGDTSSSEAGDLFVFFAAKTPLFRENLIDAIAVDSITDPALTDFVAKYRKAKPKVPPAG